MESSIIVIIVLIYLTTLTFASNDIDQSLDNKNIANNEEQKVLLDCQHLDYRTYIKCLKRQKRHHAHGHWDHHNSTGGPKTCYEDCGVDLCTSTQCVHDCHTRCMKKTKETRIVQYETDCSDDNNGNCHSKKDDNYYQAPPNITTNIDVNNIIHNHMPNDRDSENNNKEGSKNYTDSRPPVNSPGYPGTPGFPGGPGLTPGPPGLSGLPGGYGLNIIPQIQLVPQLTFGLGLGPIGGCLTNLNWPCVQQPTAVDCSQCNNPFYRPRCEISCWNQGNYSQDSGRRY
ncbi:hypothetical protein HCN44_008510 [Aphidius gifuensis]|uniref:Odorant-binding protein n=1 Tax=Aphidius gifuensis TaxID=684658 RepID=A0A834XS83_APHGI|nr:uncharacterized protein LOC122858244 [Aphidius gifuensis]KAF7989836.1 hypothetical protein HCN44_008510 [Aphidius gifuensis]